MFKKMAVFAVVVLAASTLAFAGEVQTEKGQIESVSGNVLTIETDNGDVMSFEVRSSSRIIAEGASHRTAALNLTGEQTALSEFVRDGQHVTVDYWEENGTRYIKKLRVHCAEHDLNQSDIVNQLVKDYLTL